MSTIIDGTAGITFPNSTTQAFAVPAPSTSGNVLTSNGTAWASQAAVTGLTMADLWRMNTSVQGNTNPLTNWTRATTAPNGTTGSAMTVSSGVFTFPSTGVYYIEFVEYIYSSSSTQGCQAYIYACTDGSTFNQLSSSNQGIYNYSGSYPSNANLMTSALVNVTSTSLIKVQFVFGAGQGYEYCLGSASTNQTYVVFLKVA